MAGGGSSKCCRSRLLGQVPQSDVGWVTNNGIKRPDGFKSKKVQFNSERVEVLSVGCTSVVNGCSAYVYCGDLQ
jgi:hypothetical protein